MANSIIDDTTAIAKRLREITGETMKAKVVKIDCIHCRDAGWVRHSVALVARFRVTTAVPPPVAGVGFLYVSTSPLIAMKRF